MSASDRFIWSRVFAAAGLFTSTLLTGALVHSRVQLADSRTALEGLRNEAELEAGASEAALDRCERDAASTLDDQARRHETSLASLRSTHAIAVERLHLARQKAEAMAELARTEAALLGAAIPDGLSPDPGLDQLRKATARIAHRFEGMEARVDTLEGDNRTLLAQVQAKDRVITSVRGQLDDRDQALDDARDEHERVQATARELQFDKASGEARWNICAFLPRGRRDSCAATVDIRMAAVADEWRACLASGGSLPGVHKTVRDDPALHPNFVLWEHRNEAWAVELCDLGLVDQAG